LGGTRFAGRHIVEVLAGYGHRVVCFHRGRTNCSLPGGVEERLGDRNGDLGAADTERWDAIVDVNGQEPQQLTRSLQLRADRYLFVSTVSVYRDLSRPHLAEDAAVIDASEPDDEASRYGRNKAACERLVQERYPHSSIVLRPGLIAGKWDYTGRFSYWCERFLRGGLVLAPSPTEAPVQFVDAADLARFVHAGLSRELTGVFNVVGPAQRVTLGELLAQCATVARECGAEPSRVFWGDGARLTERGVEPWTQMPLWLGDQAQWAGLMQIDNAKALDAGLELRPIAQTVRSILEWVSAARPPNPAGLSAQREAELIAALREAPRVRPALADDLPAILRIYNEGIEDRVATLDTDPKSAEEIAEWFRLHDDRYAAVVATAAGAIVGWASLNPFSERCAHRAIADLSVYVARWQRGRGIGSALLRDLEQRAAAAGFRKIVLHALNENEPGKRLYRRSGFAEVGVFKEHGILDGRYVDVVAMERLL
jgi:2'-hydroxyisoflavone reductase